MIRHVLLIPAPGNPGGLLREGPCGARPPAAHRGGRCVSHEECLIRHAGDSTQPAAGCNLSDFRRALVLAWDGEPVDEGCDRAVRAVRLVARGALIPLFRTTYSIEDALDRARDCEAAGLGAVVIVEGASDAR